MNEPSPAQLTEALRQEAELLGFTLFGVVRPQPSEHMAFYDAWLERDYHGEMAYLARDDARERRSDPLASFPPAQSIVVVGHEYGNQRQESLHDGPSDRHSDDAVIARYARGNDYHSVIPELLERLLAWLDGETGEDVRGRVLVDTAPVLERELARRAGVGWFGRNTMLIHPERGSYFLLGLLMVDLELGPSEPFSREHCGTCRACVDACPTGALLGRDEVGAPVIDARRCISYLTIELKGPIPLEHRAAMGNRVFGCDICQEVCPWNERFSRGGDPTYAPGAPAESLIDFAARLLDMSEKGYQRAYAQSPLARPRRKGMLRNLLVGIGNALRADACDSETEREALTVLRTALSDAQPLVRGHAAWALGQMATASASTALLRARQSVESDPYVLEEIDGALRAD